MIKLEGGDQFGRLAVALRQAGDRDLRTAVYRAIRTAARPLGDLVVKDGAARMPHRGGLSARLADMRPSIGSALSGSSPKVTIRIGGKKGEVDVRSLDAGVLRHPVFARAGRKRTWVTQTVPSGAYSDAFKRGAPAVRKPVIEAAQVVLEEIARKV